MVAESLAEFKKALTELRENQDSHLSDEELIQIEQSLAQFLRELSGEKVISILLYFEGGAFCSISLAPGEVACPTCCDLDEWLKWCKHRLCGLINARMALELENMLKEFFENLGFETAIAKSYSRGAGV